MFAMVRLHLMEKAILVQGGRQSKVISVNDLYFIMKNSKNENLGNIVLIITIYDHEILLLWLKLIHFSLRSLLLFLAC